MNHYFKRILALLCLCLAASLEMAKAQTLVTLIDYTNTWRYLKDGTDQGTAWRDKNFDDSSWAAGPGLLGYETIPSEYSAPFNTIFVDYTNSILTYYFRIHFNFPSNVNSTVTLAADMLVDDGAVLYLNGTEVSRVRVPTGQSYLTPASSFVTFEGQHDTASFSPVAGALIQGDNVLAVEVHNVANSSDIVWGMNLTATIPAPMVPITITNQPVSQINPVGTSFTLSVGVSGDNPGFQWFSNNVPIANATLATYTTAATRTNTGVDYFVVVSNAANTVTSEVAKVTTVTDTFPLSISSAFAGPYTPPAVLSNQVLINFNKRVLQSVANTNPSNYSITILGTTNSMTVTSIQVSAVQLRLTTSTPFFPGTNYVLCVSSLSGTNGVPLFPNPFCLGISMMLSNPSPPFTNLLSINQNWNWNENGVDLGTTWRLPNYVEDGSWKTGSGIFYFDPTGPQSSCFNAPFTVPTQGYFTYYFRTKFVVPSDLGSSGTLRFRHLIDDGAVFYLNGVEVGRFNIPSGPVIYQTVPATVLTPACVTNVVPISNLLQTGTNLLAVEVHELGNDPDMYFGTELDYQPSYVPLTPHTSPAPPALKIAHPTDNLVVISWNTDVGGFYWGLDTTTELRGSNTVWERLTDTNPYTNTITSRRFFRATVR